MRIRKLEQDTEVIVMSSGVSNSPSSADQHESLAEAVRKAGLRTEDGSSQKTTDVKLPPGQAVQQKEDSQNSEVAKQDAPSSPAIADHPPDSTAHSAGTASSKRKRPVARKYSGKPVQTSVSNQRDSQHRETHSRPARKPVSKSPADFNQRHTRTSRRLESKERQPNPQQASSGIIRHLLEALVLLALAVTLFRTFALEGFMISTGSMAPTLRGYHYRVDCPDCQFQFAWTATERKHRFPVRTLSNDVSTTSTGDGGPGDKKIVCPNCNYQHIGSDDLVVNEGDQLLVDKLAFEWASPKRWSSAIFRNPHRSTQAYAKRIIGLPGEVISLKDGDVYVREEIQRKNLAQQRQVRVLVSDSKYRPQFQDDNYRDSWEAIRTDNQQSWQKEDVGYRFEPLAVKSQVENGSPKSPVSDSDQQDWLVFRRWVRLGGAAKKAVSLERWPGDVSLPTENALLRYNEVTNVLSCRGALPAEVVQKLKNVSTDKMFHSALDKLFRVSHMLPITDQLAYNQTSIQLSYPVRDLMLELDVEPESLQSQLTLCMNDGEYDFSCTCDFSSRVIELSTHRNPTPLRTGTLPELQFEQTVKIEMSVMDRQVLVSVNDQLVFEPYAYRLSSKSNTPASPPGPPTGEQKHLAEVPLRPLRIGATGGPLHLKRIRVYRDLYYRQKKENRVPQEYRLQEEELFVLGDNSEVSVDSRHWEPGSVTRQLLIGRPLLLHLPSEKKTITLGPITTQIRVPDSKRIRLLR